MTATEPPNPGESPPEGTAAKGGTCGASFVKRLRDPAHWFAAAGVRWRPFVVRGLATALALLVAVGAANAAVNPRSEFPWRHYQPLVDDAASTKLHLYRDHDRVTGTLVLGSSRAMALAPIDPAGQRPGFNFALPSGTLADAEIVLEFISRDDGRPALVVIGLDSSALTLGREDVSQVRQSAAADAYTGRSRSPDEWFTALGHTIDPIYVDDSLRVLEMTYRTGYPTPFRRFDIDGVEQLPRREEQLAAGTYNLQAELEEHWEEQVRRRYEEGRRPDIGAFAPLERLVAAATANGSRVMIFLTPFHPDMLARLDGNAVFGEFQAASLEWSQTLCGPSVEVFDFTDSATFNGSPQEFYDGYHMTRANGSLALQAMFAGQGRLCGGPP